jgi:hypothetical protein
VEAYQNAYLLDSTGQKVVDCTFKHFQN